MSAAGGTLESVLSLGAPRHAREVMCGDEQHWTVAEKLWLALVSWPWAALGSVGQHW